MGTETTQEKRIRRLEDLMNALKGVLEGIKHKLGQVAEDNSRDTKPLPADQVERFFRCQASGGISASSGNALGGGNAKLLQVISGSRYQLDPPQTVAVVNDTGGAIPNLTYCVGAYVNGVRTILVADCATASPTAAPAPPGG